MIGIITNVMELRFAAVTYDAGVESNSFRDTQYMSWIREVQGASATLACARLSQSVLDRSLNLYQRLTLSKSVFVSVLKNNADVLGDACNKLGSFLVLLTMT